LISLAFEEPIQVIGCVRIQQPNYNTLCIKTNEW